jgi:hypothetical protein
MRRLLPLAVLLTAWGAAADPYAVGDTLEAITLEDQHDTPHALDASVRLVLFSRDMDGGKVLKRALEGAPGDILSKQSALYVADIERMPGLIARMFALPSMRRRPYPMLLDRDGTKTARLPSEEGKATLLFLNQLRLERVLYTDSQAEVRDAIGLPPEDHTE